VYIFLAYFIEMTKTFKRKNSKRRTKKNRKTVGGVTVGHDKTNTLHVCGDENSKKCKEDLKNVKKQLEKTLEELKEIDSAKFSKERADYGIDHLEKDIVFIEELLDVFARHNK
jgi:hypothetical protein